MIREPIQKMICWSIEHLQEAQMIGGIALYDLRFHEDTRPADVTSSAVLYLDRADPRFRSLVDHNVRMVVASRFQQSIYVASRAYFSRFQKWEGRSPLFFASKLVWVGEYLRLANSSGRKNDEPTLRACTLTQLAFLDSVGEDAEWIPSLRRKVSSS